MHISDVCENLQALRFLERSPSAMRWDFLSCRLSCVDYAGWACGGVSTIPLQGTRDTLIIIKPIFISGSTLTDGNCKFSVTIQ